LEEAKRGEGATVFDWLLEILAVHAADGSEGEDGVGLVLS
jgi:hypothetical protein